MRVIVLLFMICIATVQTVNPRLVARWQRRQPLTYRTKSMEAFLETDTYLWLTRIIGAVILVYLIVALVKAV